MADSKITDKASEIVNTADAAYFGVIDENGYPSVSTVSSIKADGIFKAWYAGGLYGNKAKRIVKNSKASVCYRRDGDNVTLVGEAKIVTDRDVKHALWQDWFIDHFSGGKDDPDYCVIEFTTQRVSLWVGWQGAEFDISDMSREIR